MTEQLRRKTADRSSFQLTSSRRGWQDYGLGMKVYKNISTHILTKRMTKSTNCITIASDISTHILTKRMTEVAIKIAGKLDISTHILTKRMTTKAGYSPRKTLISTHILTKRMTGGRPHCRKAAIYFNSHPHEEDDGKSKADGTT